MYRTVACDTWDDPWFMDLTPHSKLLFLYLFTNARTTPCGVYEVPLKKMAFDTGLSADELTAALAELTAEGKVVWWADLRVVWVRNFYKRQRANSNPAFAGAAKRALAQFHPTVRDAVGVTYPELAIGDMSHPPATPLPPSSDGGNVEQQNSRTAEQKDPNPIESTIPPPSAAAPPVPVDNFTPFFEAFWATFPGRPNPEHRPTGREPTRKALKRLPARDWDAILVGATHYATCRQAVKGYAKDPVKWLHERLWEEWQAPETAESEIVHGQQPYPVTRADRTESAWAAHLRPAGDLADVDSRGRGGPPGGPAQPRRVIALPARVG